MPISTGSPHSARRIPIGPPTLGSATARKARFTASAPILQTVTAFFAGDPPRTAAGKLALARVAHDAGHLDQAAALVRGVWRDDDLDAWTESALLGEFAALLTHADHKYPRRAAALRRKGSGRLCAPRRWPGADELALAKVWANAIRGPVPEAALDAIPASLKSDPGLLYLRVQSLRRADRVLEAALLLRNAPRGAALIDGDRWWDERRMIARRLLDAGLAQGRLCALRRTFRRLHSLAHRRRIPRRLDRFAFPERREERRRSFRSRGGDRANAALDRARRLLAGPRRRGGATRANEAQRFYERAAAYPIAYYGQLAAEKLHIPGFDAARAAQAVATGEARNEATRVVELLYAAKLDRLSRLSLAIDAARSYRDEAQLAALAEVAAARRDGLASVEIGKQAMERGFALDESAFPTFGVPSFAPLANSAELAAVYSVARQESEFAGGAASGAGAKGLMQILPSTARDTARRMGVAFDPARLTADPAYNTQLGAAFLGQLIDDEGGSYAARPRRL